jgi:predicted 3-demethylubiquinone-9 3-methyltransferase (glyoxalase superfamily)
VTGRGAVSSSEDTVPSPKGVTMPQRITPNLWFDNQAEEAAEHYVSIFPNSRIVHVARYPEGAPGPAGNVMVVEFELDGERVVAINGGPQFTFSEAVSLQVSCDSQEEVDYYWERLSDGGEEGPCGWLKDRYGLSWQVTPRGMDEVFSDPDPKRAERAMQAMLGMKKLDIAELQRAADGVAA